MPLLAITLKMYNTKGVNDGDNLGVNVRIELYTNCDEIRISFTNIFS